MFSGRVNGSVWICARLSSGTPSCPFLDRRVDLRAVVPDAPQVHPLPVYLLDDVEAVVHR
jgi:hypothetical protein